MRSSGHFRVERNAAKVMTPDNAAADTERESEAGADADPAMVFDLFDRFRRKILDRLHAHDFSRANLAEIPT